VLIPPLRERPEDIEVLAEALHRSLRRRHGYPYHRLSPTAVEYLRSRSWPGNVRELSHLLEAALILRGGDPLDDAALSRVQPMRPGGEGFRQDRGVEEPAEQGGPSTPSESPEHRPRYSFPGTSTEEKTHIQETLDACRWNRSRAARRLGMARNTLRSKIREFDLEPR
jgi:DNA-binding NtrC family response regulator